MQSISGRIGCSTPGFKTTLAFKIVDNAFNAQVFRDFCYVRFNKLPYKFSDNFNEMAKNINKFRTQ